MLEGPLTLGGLDILQGDNPTRRPREQPQLTPSRGCSFCAKFGALMSSSTSAFYDTPLFQNELFVIVPTLGSFVPGYLLLVPRQHTLNFAALRPGHLHAAELLLESTLRRATSIWGDCIVFEHGPCAADQNHACIDHAHWHIVPSAADIESYLHPRIIFAELPRLDEGLENAMWGDQSYLLIKQRGHWLLAESQAPPTQFIRRVLCQLMHLGDVWNWRCHPFYNNIMETYSGWFGAR